MKLKRDSRDGLPIVFCRRSKDWGVWLRKNVAADGVWLRIAKKSSGLASVTYDEAVDEALCHGWIDGLKNRFDDASWLQRFTPRRPQSIWSKVNKAKVAALVKAGRMRPAGHREVERAKKNGRWKAAYGRAGPASVPADFQRALNRNGRAKAFFATLKNQKRYAIIFWIQSAKKPETRVKRIGQFIEMLKNHEML
ncbi:MAG: YdeI/OmpD-associated family protein [Phycisphaerae bacterium]